MNHKENMLRGELYLASDPELRQLHRHALQLTARYNRTDDEQETLRQQLLEELLGSCPQHLHIEPTFRCDYGFNITIGEEFFANYDCILLDVCPITIGRHVMLGPRVCIYTAAHPLDRTVRDAQWEYGQPVTIGDSVWIGGNVVINPGVTIGSDVVIGSGSVVTHDLPSHVIAAGNPCRVLRPISPQDQRIWQRRWDQVLARQKAESDRES